jgi:hypothetical protein
MRSISCVAIALAMAFSCAAASANNGTILFSRSVNGTYNGYSIQVGTGLFLIDDNGAHYKQLTPLVADSYYMPSGVAYPGGYGSIDGTWVFTGTWLTKNFSPDGQSVQYFAGQTSNPLPNSMYPRKYTVMNLATGATQAPFAGGNDNALPGYGYLAWGPAGSNQIAYTNSTSESPTSPPCVMLMQPDGSDQHTLWCAPPTINIAQGPVPSLAIGAIRWAGNGKSLLAYVSYQPVPLTLPKKSVAQSISGYTGFAALYDINVQTGIATLIAPDVPDPAFGDISYDGNVVLYQKQDMFSCNDDNLEANGASLCVTNLATGTVTSVFPEGVWQEQGVNGQWWSTYWYPQALLSPDGTKVVVTMQATDSTLNQGDLYVVNVDGTNLRQLTTRDPNAPTNAQIAWIPVAWSPDGHQLLVNHVTGPALGQSTDQTKSSEVNIIALSDGRAWDVTSGYAVDWLKGPCQ